MSKFEADTYIPYVPTAESIMEGDYFRLFVKSLGIPPDTAEKLYMKVVGLVHDGIETGLALSANEPLGNIEAYRLGFEEGVDEAQKRKGY